MSQRYGRGYYPAYASEYDPYQDGPQEVIDYSRQTRGAPFDRHAYVAERPLERDTIHQPTLQQRPAMAPAGPIHVRL